MRMLPTLSVLFVALQAATPTDLCFQAPQTSSQVMVDGVFSQGEWQSAARVEVSGAARIYLQQLTDFVYIAVEYPNSPPGIVDFIFPDTFHPGSRQTGNWRA